MDLNIIKRRLSRYNTIVRNVLIVILIVVLIYGLRLAVKPVTTFLKRSLRGPLFFLSFVIDKDINLKSTHGRTNFLVLGVGGDNHTAADLTDTIMLVSVDSSKPDVASLSIPRDLWVPSLQAKTNSAYHYGEEKMPDGGLILAKAAVSEVLDQPVHYAVLIDFDGFVTAVDVIGGIDVQVKQAFDDYKFPVPGKETAYPESSRYEHLHFDQGERHFDGQLALKYARSRNAEGKEGTDIARSERQQQILSAFKNKVFSPKILLNFKTINRLLKTLSGSLKSDLTEDDYLDLIRLAWRSAKVNPRSITLEYQNSTNGQNGILYNPSSFKDNQWVLLPKNDDWSLLYKYINCLIEQPEGSVCEDF